MEEELLKGSQEVFCNLLEKAAQQKADSAPPLCPCSQNKLSRLSDGHVTSIQARFGLIRVQRLRGYCRRCRKWRFPADGVLGLPEEGTQSPSVQEMAGLTVSKMPAREAEQVWSGWPESKFPLRRWGGPRASRVSGPSNSGSNWIRK